MRNISTLFNDICSTLTLLGNHYAAHSYRVIITTIMEQFESSAHHPSSLTSPSYIDAVLRSVTAPTKLIAIARRTMRTLQAPAFLHRIRSNPKLTMLMMLSHRIGVSTARRLLRSHRCYNIADVLQRSFLSDSQCVRLTNSPQPMTRAEADKIVATFRGAITDPLAIVVPCGEYRRYHSTMTLLIVIISAPNDDLTNVTTHASVTLSLDPVTVVIDGRYRVRVRVVPWSQRYIAIVNATGSDEFVRRLRWYARDRGYLLTNDDRIMRLASPTTPYTVSVDNRFDSERAVFNLIGLDYVTPRWRDAFRASSSATVPMMRTLSFRPFRTAARATIRRLRRGCA